MKATLKYAMIAFLLLSSTTALAGINEANNAFKNRSTPMPTRSTENLLTREMLTRSSDWDKYTMTAKGSRKIISRQQAGFRKQRKMVMYLYRAGLEPPMHLDRV